MLPLWYNKPTEVKPKLGIYIMKQFIIYRQTEATVRAVSDFINRNGWDVASKSEDLSIRLKMLPMSLRSDSIYTKDDIDTTMEAIKQDILLPVAIIEAGCLDEVYRLSNSIVCPWIENEEVTLLTDLDIFYSSTSVGDIIKDVDTGTFHVVLNYGFQEIGVK